MPTVTYGGAVSLDGFLAGVDGSIDWLHFSKDVQQVMTDYWKDVDTILMGRKTYEVSVAMRPSSAKRPTKAKSTKRKEPTMYSPFFLAQESPRSATQAIA
jgi:dihydrofolate reductase